MKRSIKIGSRTLPVWLFAAILVIAAVVAASVIFAAVHIGYRITPGVTEPPSMTPNPLNLDLGDIPSGSSGSREFIDAAVLDLTVSYEITFTLDLTTVGDFDTFTVSIYLYVQGETVYTYFFYLENIEYWNYSSKIVDTGTYDVRVEISYTAVSVTSETTGSVKVDVSYPG